LPARLKTFDALLGNSIDRFTQIPLSIQAGHAPAQKTDDRDPHLVIQQLAKLIETVRARVPPARRPLSDNVPELTLLKLAWSLRFLNQNG
jgi:hypothetical protein